MKLAELEPELVGTVADGLLSFDCPHPSCNRGHRVRVSISAAAFHERPARSQAEMAGRTGKVKVWQATGVFPDSLTLSPSIDIIEANEKGEKIRTLCWHGFITNGDAR